MKSFWVWPLDVSCQGGKLEGDSDNKPEGVSGSKLEGDSGSKLEGDSGSKLEGALLLEGGGKLYPKTENMNSFGFDCCFTEVFSMKDQQE